MIMAMYTIHTLIHLVGVLWWISNAAVVGSFIDCRMVASMPAYLVQADDLFPKL